MYYRPRLFPSYRVIALVWEQPECDLALLPLAYRPPGGVALQLLTAGSDRKFYRFSKRGQKYILLHDTALEDNFIRYIKAQQFLATEQIGVPTLYYYDISNRLAVLEDLENCSLEEVTSCENQEVITSYRQVIDFLVYFQSKGHRVLPSYPVLCDRTFNNTMLRWETWYFRTYFLGLLNGVSDAKSCLLLPEYKQLAHSFTKTPQTLIHRDFQAQNIYVTASGVKIIDFQELQEGPMAYDIVSLIRDPYANLSDMQCRELLEYYQHQILQQSGVMITAQMVFSASLQRLLQALGAYGYLACVKGKKIYLEHIPVALRQLHDVFYGFPEQYPRLQKVLNKYYMQYK